MEYLIYASLVIITVLCLWVLITLPKNYLLKALLVPVMLLIAVSTWYTYNALMGYGTKDKPTETVLYHYHITDEKRDRIYVLLIEMGKSDPRLHIFPYTQELGDQLEEVRERSGEGVVVLGQFEMKAGRMLDDEGIWVFYEFPPDKYMPKGEAFLGEE